jgi:hypothetical protein
MGQRKGRCEFLALEIQLYPKSFILQVYDVMARQTLVVSQISLQSQTEDLV